MESGIRSGTETLGIYGYGRIGKVVADYGRAFGMNVVFWASDESRERAAGGGNGGGRIQGVVLRGQCDVISLHLRLVEAHEASLPAAISTG